ncbi:hypothetical protein [Absidia glauca]|uniref:Uncharacterized protein n=1 Tax=Absidia glauca TaxID=4829 RepID=A0A168SJK5_ABSGL|nr:hypothetical protein [Absidia glauca]
MIPGSKYAKLRHIDILSKGYVEHGYTHRVIGITMSPERKSPKQGQIVPVCNYNVIWWRMHAICLKVKDMRRLIKVLQRWRETPFYRLVGTSSFKFSAQNHHQDCGQGVQMTTEFAY